MDGSQDEDAALMLRVQAGDIAAFESLVARYQQPIMTLVTRMLRDTTEAEDIAQHVFVQVYKAAHRYKPSAKFSTWLFTIARNLSLNELRRRSRHPADSMDSPHPQLEEQPAKQIEDIGTISPPDTVLHQELIEKVDEAIQALPPNQRTALLLCREEEFSYDDISKVLGCSLSAVKSLIHRGRETIKKKLKPYLESGT